MTGENPALNAIGNFQREWRRWLKFVADHPGRLDGLQGQDKKHYDHLRIHIRRATDKLDMDGGYALGAVLIHNEEERASDEHAT